MEKVHALFRGVLNVRVRVVSMTAAAGLAAAAFVALPSGPAQAAATCTAAHSFDVNGDGVEDTAIGAAHEDVGSGEDAGAVWLVYGSAGGGFGSGSRLITQEVVGGGVSEDQDLFGASLAIGDLNNDGCKDLAIGSPGENGYGRVVVLFGRPTGMTGKISQSFTQSSAGVPGSAEKGDRFGETVAIQGTGASAALWVGIPGEDIGKAIGAGALERFPAGKAGGKLPTIGITQVTQNSSGVPGGAETGDAFGKVLSGGPHALVVGVPQEDLKNGAGVNQEDAGAVYVHTATTWTVLSQETPSPLVPGGAEVRDRFGAAVAQLPSCTHNANDVAVVVGTPDEDVAGPVIDGGTATVIDVPAGSTLGLTLGDTTVPGPAENGDEFGLRLATSGDFLVVGAPQKDVGGQDNAGNLFQAEMTCTGSVPTVGAHGSLSLDGDVFGDPFKGDRFGRALAFARTQAGAEPSMLVGTPLKADGSVLDAGRVTVLPQKVGGLYVGTGSAAFGQSDSGIVGGAEDSDQFGDVIASTG